ncbi:FUSC family protein [Streptomyces sp. 549]|uniref:FUSC family protein n=1 Tax=Streptomyces sp. 549 TaxID=3049076 RepID=UPI0024C2D387|nr:FUSC family protein [Streptomyces sp. 549]MDK1476155.1 FUSC family protein [Streptomyces sp. 549]
MTATGRDTLRSWAKALRDTARSGVRVERAALTPLIAVRGACGVALVVGLALWLGTPALAVSSAFGAFASGIATFQRSWRPRPELALGAAAGLSASAFLGYLLAGSPPAFFALLLLWSFAAGMAWAVGPVSGVVAGFTVACMLIVVTLPGSVPDAGLHALTIALGGVVQAGLIVVFPIRRWGARRDALADALAGVADYARRLRHDPVAPFDPQPLMEARSAAAVSPRQARRRPRQLRGYRALAERFRPVLASLADPVVGGAAADGPERDRVRELLGAAATVLDSTARAIRRAEPVRVPSDALDSLKVPADGPVLPAGPARKAALRLIALSEEAVDAAEQPVEVTAGGRPPYLRRPGGPSAVAVALRAVRRELRSDSAVLRHALRLAAVVAVGQVIGGWLSPEHGYWIALTVVMVLRPDFSQTFERGSARLVGTVAGVAVAGVVLALARPGPAVCAALAVLSVFALYLLMRTGYSVVSGWTSAYVVFLLGVVGQDWAQTVPERIELTLVGGVLALLSYPVLPVWETPRLRDRLADWLAANCRYAAAVVHTWDRPAQARPRQVREAQLDARAARSEWEQATARAGAEPVRHRGLSRRSAAEAQSALLTMGRVTMLLEAQPTDPALPPDPGAEQFARALTAAAGPAADALRAGVAPRWDTVHTALDEWRRNSEHSEGVAVRVAELLTDALDELAAAVTPRPGPTGRRGQQPGPSSGPSPDPSSGPSSGAPPG